MKSLLRLIEKQKFFIFVVIIALSLAGTFAYKELYIPVSNQNPPIKDFPAMPIYPNAVLINSSTDPKEGVMYIGVKFGATWKTKEQVPEVAKWYTQKLKNSGWTLDTGPADSNARDVQLVSFYNDKYNLNMSFSRDDYAKETLITAEFSTNYKVFCEGMYNGKPCTN